MNPPPGGWTTEGVYQGGVQHRGHGTFYFWVYLHGKSSNSIDFKNYHCGFFLRVSVYQSKENVRVHPKK